MLKTGGIRNYYGRANRHFHTESAIAAKLEHFLLRKQKLSSC